MRRKIAKVLWKWAKFDEKLIFRGIKISKNSEIFLAAAPACFEAFPSIPRQQNYLGLLVTPIDMDYESSNNRNINKFQ